MSCRQTRGTFVLEIDRLLADIGSLPRTSVSERLEYIDTLAASLYCSEALKDTIHDLISQAIAVTMSLNTLRGVFAPPPVNIFASQAPFNISQSIPMYYTQTSQVYQEMPTPPKQDIRVAQIRQVLLRIKQIALTIDCIS